jgi:hypothetical protein
MYFCRRTLTTYRLQISHPVVVAGIAQLQLQQLQHLQHLQHFARFAFALFAAVRGVSRRNDTELPTGTDGTAATSATKPSHLSVGSSSEREELSQNGILRLSQSHHLARNCQLPLLPLMPRYREFLRGISVVTLGFSRFSHSHSYHFAILESPLTPHFVRVNVVLICE